MTHGVSPLTRVPLRVALDGAIDFLVRGQLSSGQFRVERTRSEPAVGVVSTTPDETPFATAHIAHSLSFSPHPVAREMIARAVRFLRSEQVGPGVWRHWNKSSPWHRVIPPDVDDTACISCILARHAGGAPDNEGLLLLNRDGRGLFYTWLIPRPVLTASTRYWGLCVRDLNIARLFAFWRRTEARRGDIDAVVNANVLLYLGERPETAPVVEFLINTVREAREEGCDKWYHSRQVLYYALSRAYAAGVRRLGEVREVVHERLAAAARPDGRIGAGGLDTALAVCALVGMVGASPLLEAAVAYLLGTQEGDGGWASEPFYFGGPKELAAWGSRELTTGFCVEALERFDAHRAAPDQVS